MNARSNILYLCGGRSFRTDRAGRKIAGIIDCWRRIGHGVLLVSGGDILGISRGAKERNEYGAVSFHRQWYRRLGILGPVIHTLSERLDIHHDAAMVQHLEESLKSFRPDLIWERSCRLHCAGLVFARRLGVPYVLEWKDNIASYRLSWYGKRAREMERHKNEQSDFIVTESEVLLNQLMRDGGDTGKIIVAHNAVDSRLFQRDLDAGLRTRNELGVAPGTVLVGYLGSYAWYHDASLLVKSMDVLRKRGHSHVRCLMVGEGKDFDVTRRLAKKRGLLDCVVIMKPGVPKDAVPGLLAALDIAVLPGSTDIICPIKVQEYMASALPSVVPDYLCNREVLRDGETGALFRPRDEFDLAEKIMWLAVDEERRMAIGRRARAEAVQRFSWEATWGAALETVLERERTKSAGLAKPAAAR